MLPRVSAVFVAWDTKMCESSGWEEVTLAVMQGQWWWQEYWCMTQWIKVTITGWITGPSWYRSFTQCHLTAASSSCFFLSFDDYSINGNLSEMSDADLWWLLTMNDWKLQITVGGRWLLAMVRLQWWVTVDNGGIMVTWRWWRRKWQLAGDW